jgi:hypothetical protein
MQHRRFFNETSGVFTHHPHKHKATCVAREGEGKTLCVKYME